MIEGTDSIWTEVREVTKRRLQGALICYGALALVAGVALRGRFLAVVLVLLAGLVVKSWVVYKKEEL